VETVPQHYPDHLHKEQELQETGEKGTLRRAESREQKAESREQRAESREQGAESREQRA